MRVDVLTKTLAKNNLYCLTITDNMNSYMSEEDEIKLMSIDTEAEFKNMMIELDDIL